MSSRSGRARRLVLVAACLLPLGAACASRPLRASIAAAYRAFRDPSLLERAPAPPAPEAPLALPPSRDDAAIDAELAREFAQATSRDLAGAGSLERLALPELRVPVTRRVLRYVHFLTETPAGRAAFAQRLRRYGRYRGLVEPLLRDAGLPEDLVWLAAVESGFDPGAVSPKGAAGMWQFMPETGRAYGLEQTPWVDERRSLVRSTAAAAAHLRDLYERFGRWDLALAAYNLGAGGVLDAIDRVLATDLPGERTAPVGFADLAQRRAIPDETASYVPQIMAFAIVAANRARFGFEGAELAPPIELAELVVPAGTRVATIARSAGVPTSIIREHNPELLLDRVPDGGGDYLVQIPADRVSRTLASFPVHADNEVVSDAEVGEARPSDPTLPVLADALALGPGDEAPDEPVPLATPTLEAWASLGSPLPARPRWLGKNRVPFFASPDAWSAPLTGDAGAFAVAAAAPSGFPRLSAQLFSPELLEGRLASLARTSWGGSSATGRLRRVGTFRGDAVPDAPPSAGAPASPQRPPPRAEPAPANATAGAEPPRAPEPLRFRLSSGAEVELTPDGSAPGVHLEVRVLERGEGALGDAEVSRSIDVAPRDLEVGVALASGWLRAIAVERSGASLALLRRAAGEARRRTLEGEPYGGAWLALGEALFPPGHALEGTVLGLRGDARSALDALLVDVMRRRAAERRVLVRAAGDVGEARLRALLEPAIGALAADERASVTPHPRLERVRVEAGVPDARLLTGWIVPGEGEPGDAATRVAIELLAGRRSKLRARLVDERRLASEVSGALELGPVASVAAIEVTPAIPHDPDEVDAALIEAIEAFLESAPSADEVAHARGLVVKRLGRELEAARGEAAPGAPRSASSARVRGAVDRGAIERAIEAVRRVTPDAVREAAERALSPDHRVVVVTEPRGREPSRAAR
jgi:soluble lytic murein transglycosylase-like protein/predicted Zn-dependent peptidase